MPKIKIKNEFTTLSRLLGHSSVTVTEKAYLDLSDEDLLEFIHETKSDNKVLPPKLY